MAWAPYRVAAERPACVELARHAVTSAAPRETDADPAAVGYEYDALPDAPESLREWARDALIVGVLMISVGVLAALTWLLH